MRPNRILVPVDFTDRSLHAARLGAALARRFGSDMTLLHVDELDRFAPMVSEAPADGASALRDLSQVYPLWAAEELDALGEELGSAGVSVHAKVQSGRAAKVILETAVADGAELIVLGAHGHGEGGHLLGSTTLKVARGARCPVLVARPSDSTEGDDSGRFRRALVAVDISPGADRTAEWLIKATASLLDPAGESAELHALHVLPNLAADPLILSRTGEGISPVAVLQRHVHTHAHERLCAIVRNCNLDVEGLQTEAEVEVGRPSDVVLEHAALRRSDLIAIAAHRPHGIAEHLRGTTADAVLRHANVAILTVPAELDDLDESSE